MSHKVSFFLLVSMCLLLTLRTTNAQELPNMVLCENTQVSLGQSKQQVRTALAVCCRLKNNRLDFPDGTASEQPNQISFEANRVGTCSGSVLFDTAEKLVYAQRDLGQFNEGESTLGLAHALTEGISNLLPNRTTNLGGQNGTVTNALANVELHVTAGPVGSQNTLFVSVVGRTLRFEVLDFAQVKLVVVQEEIGDLRKGDLRSVPIRK